MKKATATLMDMIKKVGELHKELQGTRAMSIMYLGDKFTIQVSKNVFFELDVTPEFCAQNGGRGEYPIKAFAEIHGCKVLCLMTVAEGIERFGKDAIRDAVYGKIDPLLL